jgi:hypothetical protein
MVPQFSESAGFRHGECWLFSDWSIVAADVRLQEGGSWGCFGALAAYGSDGMAFNPAPGEMPSSTCSFKLAHDCSSLALWTSQVVPRGGHHMAQHGGR